MATGMELAVAPPARGLVVQGGRVYFSMEDMQQMAKVCAESKLFGVKSPEAALGLFLLAQAEGIHPMKAAMEYDIIDGKPSLKAKSKLARFIASGGTVEWIERTDQCVAARFSHPAGGTIVVHWDQQMVQNAGLAGKDNHRKYPRAMKTARVISEGVDAIMPGVSQGLYVPEEIQDFDNDWNQPKAQGGSLEQRSRQAEQQRAYAARDAANSNEITAKYEVVPAQQQHGITAGQALNVIEEVHAEADAQRAAAPGPSNQPTPQATPGAGPTDNGEMQGPIAGDGQAEIPQPNLPCNQLIIVNLKFHGQASPTVCIYAATDPVSGITAPIFCSNDEAMAAFGEQFNTFEGEANVQLTWLEAMPGKWIHKTQFIGRKQQ